MLLFFLVVVVSPMPACGMFTNLIERFVVVLVYSLIHAFKSEFLQAQSGSARASTRIAHPGFAYHKLFIFAHVCGAERWIVPSDPNGAASVTECGCSIQVLLQITGPRVLTLRLEPCCHDVGPG